MRPRLYLNPYFAPCLSLSALFSPDDVLGAASFLASIPAQITPLCRLDNMAQHLGLTTILVKDESSFLNLNAFKGRGAFWAAAKVCARFLHIAQENLSFPALQAPLQGLPRPLLFVSATDGNHGTAIAAAANMLGQNAAIFMPAGSSDARVSAIRSLGAHCQVTDCNYDDTVRLAASYAAHSGGFLVQDTAWPGYEEIPTWIMQGYATMVNEIIAKTDGQLPTHVFLQVGVGSFAAAIIHAFLQNAAQANISPPRFICMEPTTAAPLCKSFAAASKKPLRVTGSLQTSMEGLACGELSSLAWPVLRTHAFAAISCQDVVAQDGMRLLVNPLPGDPPILAGPSGSPGLALLHFIMRENPAWQKLLHLNQNSRVLLVATEGQFEPAPHKTPRHILFNDTS